MPIARRNQRPGIEHMVGNDHFIELRQGQCIEDPRADVLLGRSAFWVGTPLGQALCSVFSMVRIQLSHTILHLPRF